MLKILASGIKKSFYFFFPLFLLWIKLTICFFSFNFWQFARDIRLGQLDFHLLKPAHSLFIVFTRNLAIPGLITAFISLAAINLFWHQGRYKLDSMALPPFAPLSGTDALIGY